MTCIQKSDVLTYIIQYKVVNILMRDHARHTINAILRINYKAAFQVIEITKFKPLEKKYVNELF